MFCMSPTEMMTYKTRDKKKKGRKKERKKLPITVEYTRW